jgi:hypothetical protein
MKEEEIWNRKEEFLDPTLGGFRQCYLCKVPLEQPTKEQEAEMWKEAQEINCEGLSPEELSEGFGVTCDNCYN